jgi:hypothetical protein
MLFFFVVFYDRGCHRTGQLDEKTTMAINRRRYQIEGKKKRRLLTFRHLKTGPTHDRRFGHGLGMFFGTIDDSLT